MASPDGRHLRCDISLPLQWCFSVLWSALSEVPDNSDRWFRHGGSSERLPGPPCSEEFSSTWALWQDTLIELTGKKKEIVECCPQESWQELHRLSTWHYENPVHTTSILREFNFCCELLIQAIQATMPSPFRIEYEKLYKARFDVGQSLWSHCNMPGLYIQKPY